MESVLHHELSYTQIPQLMQQQRTALNSHLKAFIYPGLQHFSDESAPPLPIDRIPGKKLLS